MRLEEDLSALSPSKAKPGLFCIGNRLHRFGAQCLMSQPSLSFGSFIVADVSVFFYLICAKDKCGKSIPVYDEAFSGQTYVSSSNPCIIVFHTRLCQGLCYMQGCVT